MSSSVVRPVLWFRTIRTNRTVEYVEHLVAECSEQNAIEFRFDGTGLANGDGGGLIQRVAVDAAADRGKGDRSNLMLPREVERGAVARSQQRRLAVRAASPDRTNRVNDVTRAQIESGGDATLPGWTSHVRPHLGNRQTCFVELMPRSAVDGAVDAAAAKHPLVGRVDDGVNVELRDVAAHHFNHSKNDPTHPNHPKRSSTAGTKDAAPACPAMGSK